MSAIFIANAYRIELEFTQILTLVVSAVLSAVGAAGVPGTGFIMLSAVLSSAGLPVEGLVLLAGIDRLREMVSTVINSLGDAIVAIVIAKQENEIDLSIYHEEISTLSQAAT
jgi:Na+/H+-dicarboxylate symporter